MNIKNYLNKNLLLATALVIPVITQAATPPPAAPTISDLANAGACTAYAQQMENWVNQFPSDYHNSYWFSQYGFAGTTSSDSSSGNCQNGVCTNYYDVNSAGYGSDPGCFIASTASPSAKQQLLQKLQNAYSSAIQHSSITILPNGFGLFGPASTCNNYAGCNLYYK